MRTTFEIFEAVQAGEPTTHEECRYALLVLHAIGHFRRRDLESLAESEVAGKKPLFGAQHRLEEDFRRNKTALGRDPKAYLGWGNDPENPDYRKRIAAGRRLVDRLFAKTEGTVPA